MGEAQPEIQTDPLQTVFSDIYDRSQFGENKKIKLYQSTYQSGINLVESCGYLEAPKYATSWQEKQAKRSMAATLQYIGLDTAIKGIGAYAHKLDITPEAFERLSNNLVNNYCSKNITIFSIRNVRESLNFYYKNPVMDIIPTIATSPFATEIIKNKTETHEARSREFDHVVKSFRAFCSWGGDDNDYRMLTSYLNNRFIMSFVIKNMTGVQDQIHPKTQKVVTAPSKSTVQVTCTDLICRKEDAVSFKTKFPLSVGSTGLDTDLAKLYCHHFRFQDPPTRKTNPLVQTWLKEMELEDPILETSQFISLMTGVPDFFNGIETYNEIPLMVRSSIDERWSKWSRDVLKLFSKDLLFEESFKVKVEPRRDRLALQTEGFKIDFTVTLGEMDRLMQDNDKLGLSFDLKISKNYLRSLRTKWGVLEKEVDTEGQKHLKEDIARYLNIQLKEKEKLFKQKMWNEDFSRLVAQELLEQALHYRGSLFNSYQDQILKVPVKFSYGLFALGYLRYRGDVAHGRVKLNL